MSGWINWAEIEEVRKKIAAVGQGNGLGKLPVKNELIGKLVGGINKNKQNKIIISSLTAEIRRGSCGAVVRPWLDSHGNSK